MKIRLISIILLLCGFAGAQTTHVFCASDQPCTTTANNTHSGTETFTGNLNAALFNDTWTAWFMPGADICARVENTASAAVTAGKKGISIDAQFGFHGLQPCADGLANWPWTSNANPLISAYVKFANDVNVQPPVRFHIPTATVLDFQTEHGYYFGPTNYTGGWISPATGFSDAVIVEAGSTPTGFAGSTQGARIINAGITGMLPSGTGVPGCTGYLNQHGQEKTGFSQMTFDGCPIPFDIESNDLFGGAQNAGPYENARIAFNGVSDIATNGTCFKIGTNSSGTTPLTHVGDIRNITCSCINAATGQTCNYGAYVDAHDITFNGLLKIEHSKNGFLWGSAHNVQSVKRDNFIFVAFSDTPVTNVDEFAVGGVNRSITLLNSTTQNPQYVTNLIKDNGTNGKTITAASQTVAGNEATIGRYERSGANNLVYTNAEGQFSNVPTLNEETRSATVTLSSADCGARVTYTNTGAATFNLPAALPTNICELWTYVSAANATTPAILTVNGNGFAISGTGGTSVNTLQLGFGEGARLWVNNGTTGWRVEVTAQPQIPISTPSSTTPVYTAYASFDTITLTANIVSSTINAAEDGHMLLMEWLENATGGFTNVCPTNMVGCMTINTGAGKHNRQMFKYNAAAAQWQATNPGVSF